MVAARQMVMLRTRFLALVLFTARQLFDAAMQFFDLPAHVVSLWEHPSIHPHAPAATPDAPRDIKPLSNLANRSQVLCLCVTR